MSTNCLVTKLKGTVDNSTLKKLGVITLDVTPSSSIASRLLTVGSSDAQLELKIIGDGNFITYQEDVIGNTITIAPNTVVRDYFYSAFEGQIEIHNKYKINMGSRVFSTTVNRTCHIEDLHYTNITSISGQGWIGKVSDIPIEMKSIDNITNSNTCQVTGSLKDFKRLVNLENLSIYGDSDVVMTPGPISTLGNLTKLTTLSFPSMTGTIESFVAAQRAAGRTSVSSSTPVTLLNLFTTTVTFNGSMVGGSNSTLYWDASTITLNGTTITA